MKTGFGFVTAEKDVVEYLRCLKYFELVFCVLLTSSEYNEYESKPVDH
jgi:hypothetical protein